MRHRAVVLLGSNIDARTNVAAAIEELHRHPSLRVETVSSLYRTGAVGPPGQPWFVNAAMAISTDLGPGELREQLRRLEQRLGRLRTHDRYAPRRIDLDIVLYDEVEADFDGWQLPDPGLMSPHVLVPIAEAAPDWVPPGRQASLHELAADVDRSSVARV